MHELFNLSKIAEKLSLKLFAEDKTVNISQKANTKEEASNN